MITKHATYGYLPFCTPKEGTPWFAGNVTVGYTAKETREAFAIQCGDDWKSLKKEGWRIVRVKIEVA